MSKVLLCIPPDYDHNFPPLGTPALSAFLKHNGIEVIQRDLNSRYRDFLSQHISGPSLGLQERRSLLKPLLQEFFKKKLKQRYYSDLLVRESGSLSLPYLPYDDNSNSSFFFAERLLSSKHLFRYLEDKKENTFYQMYEDERFLYFLRKEKIKLLGLSVTAPSQALPSLTLGLLVKKHLPDIHVTIGGQWPTLFREELSQRQDLFRCFDSIVVFEGETPLLRLAKALEKGKDISGIENVIVGGRPLSVSCLDPYGQDMDKLPPPDFSGLPLDAYEGRHNGQLALTFEMSRGCYWSKCAYCVDLPLPKPRYRAKDPGLIVRDIKEVKKKYGVGYLMLGDPGMSPRLMLAVSKEIIRQKVKIAWWCMARLDPGFNRRIFDIARRAGLENVNFGFESANDKVCRFLDKGNVRQRSERVIRDCYEAGIEVYLQTMLGLPGETFQDGLDTVDFLIANRKMISIVTFNIYYLTPANFIYLNPEKYGIEFKKDGLPFRFFTPFRNARGMDMAQANFLQKTYFGLWTKGVKISVDPRLAAAKKNLKLNRKIREAISFSLNNETIKVTSLFDKKSGERTLSGAH